MRFLFLNVKMFFCFLLFRNLFSLNNDFDWVYYAQKNNLKISCEEDAIKHYQRKGYFYNLPYCKKFNIAILLHLQDINNVNEFLQKINNFMRFNNQNNYYIKININASKNKNLKSFFLDEETNDDNNNDEMISEILFKKKIDPESKKLISRITDYIKQNLNLDKDKIQVIFSEDHGADIGSFFLLIDQLFSQRLSHDFIIKLHDYRDPNIRNLLTSFMNLKINKLLNNYDVIFSNPIIYDSEKDISKDFKLLLHDLNLPLKNFTYSLGSTFICSSKFTQFLLRHNIKFFNSFKDKIIGLSEVNELQEADKLDSENIESLHDNALSIASQADVNVELSETENLVDIDNQNKMEKDINTFLDLGNEISNSENECHDVINKSNIDMESLYKIYEYFFGYLFQHLNFKTKILNYIPLPFPYDNNFFNFLTKINLNYAKKLINQHNIKVMALYFPQFHEFEENNKFWGKGFTEWTLINKYQGEVKKPHVDIGQYNMLDYHTRAKQAIIAKAHGIHSFCYYHYWFKNKPVMNAGIEKILKDGEPNIPFVFCWANHTWANNWGIAHKPSQILIDQEYGTISDWLMHYNYLSAFFKHPNYIKENNCPLFFIWSIEHLKSRKCLEMLNIFRECAVKDGFSGIKIISMFYHIPKMNLTLDKYVDGYAEHQPNSQLSNAKKIGGTKLVDHLDMFSITNGIVHQNKIGHTYYRGIFYSFCNSSRRYNLKSKQFIKLSYRLFEYMIYQQLINIDYAPNKFDNYLLLNSWNEWAEQAMVEPNDYDGYEILKVIKKFFVN